MAVEHKLEFGGSMACAQMQRVARRMGVESAATRLGHRYALWTRTLEAQLLHCTSLPQGSTFKFRGRACAPIFREVPAMRRPRLDARTFDVVGGYGIVTKLWATFASLLRKLRVASANANAQVADELKMSIAKLLRAQDADLKAACHETNSRQT